MARHYTFETDSWIELTAEDTGFGPPNPDRIVPLPMIAEREMTAADIGVPDNG